MTAADQRSPFEQVQALADVCTPFAIRAATSLRVPALIASGTCELGELARACGADQDALGRLLRHLARKGLFTEPSPGRFELTETGRVLADPDPVGLADWLDLSGPAARADLACTELLHSVRTGEPAYAAVHGRTFWEDLDAEPAYQEFYDQVMIQEHQGQGPSVAALYDWSSAKLVVDVGGGTGALLAQVLRAHPHLRAVLVDRPAPAAVTVRRLAGWGLADRVEVSTGDFFGELPAGGDVYLVSRALSDWDDARALTILRRCADAAGTRGRVLVVELMHGEPFVPHGTPFDLYMLAVVGGRERSPDDLAAIARRAGLPATRAIHGPGGLLLFEMRAAP
jgi:2,7-dihydroxy-5-methyl-1-naphthoate 7-O-methyltransferase